MSDLDRSSDRDIPATTATRTFRPVVGSLGPARRFVQSHLPEDGPVEDAILLVNLLAKNAIQHARTDFQVSVHATASTVTVAVRDGMAMEGLVDILISRPGMGGRLLQAVADGWGVEILPEGKRVWASVRRLPDGEA